MVVNISKMKDKDVPAYCKNYCTVAENNMAALNLIADQITAMTDITVEYERKLDEVVALENALKEGVKGKDLCRSDLETLFKGITANIQLIPGLPDSLRAALNITIKDKIPSPLVPHQPEDLKAEGSPAGVNYLDWKKGDNKSGMVYVIESRSKDEADFRLVDMVTATRYQHKGQTPGKFMIYRIRARKGDNYSIPSNEASVYADDM